MIKTGIKEEEPGPNHGAALKPELNLIGCGHYKDCSHPCEPFAVSSRGIPLYKCQHGGLFMQGRQRPALKRYTVKGTLEKLEE